MGSRKSTTKTHSTSQNDYIDWTKGAGQKGLSDLNDVYERDKNRAPDDKVYQGDRVIGDFNEGTNAGIAASGENAKNAAHTTTDIHDMVGESINPYFEENLRNQQDRLAAKLGNSAAAGGYSTSDTGRVIGRELGAATQNALNEQWNATQARRLQANQQEQQAYRNQSANINDAIGNFGKRDVLSQAQLDAQRQKWQEGRDYDWTNLGRFIEGTNAIRSGTGTNTTNAKSESKQTPSPLDVASGVAGTVGGLFGTGGLMSLFNPTKGQ